VWPSTVGVRFSNARHHPEHAVRIAVSIAVSARDPVFLTWRATRKHVNKCQQIPRLTARHRCFHRCFSRCHHVVISESCGHPRRKNVVAGTAMVAATLTLVNNRPILSAPPSSRATTWGNRAAPSTAFFIAVIYRRPVDPALQRATARPINCGTGVSTGVFSRLRQHGPHVLAGLNPTPVRPSAARSSGRR
jgi:hypothetical protein